jgi:hypothetical protein
MCYTGKCHYEIHGGDFVGDCSLRKAIFVDCKCIEDDIAQEPEDSLIKKEYLKQLKQLEDYENSNKKIWFMNGNELPNKRFKLIKE